MWTKNTTELVGAEIGPEKAGARVCCGYRCYLRHSSKSDFLLAKEVPSTTHQLFNTLLFTPSFLFTVYWIMVLYWMLPEQLFFPCLPIAASVGMQGARGQRGQFQLHPSAERKPDACLCLWHLLVLSSYPGPCRIAISNGNLSSWGFLLRRVSSHGLSTPKHLGLRWAKHFFSCIY